jgi:hypothetical protein
MTRGNGPTSPVLVGLICLTVYLGNGRSIGSSDTQATELVALSLARGDGPLLDRFDAILPAEDGRSGLFYTRRRGHAVSLYPLAPAFLIAPMVAVQVPLLDRLRPGWEASAPSTIGYSAFMARNASAVVAALVVVVLCRLLQALDLGRGAITSAIALAFGSNLWVVASQAPWQHGPSALFLTLTLGALCAKDPGRWRFALGGLSCGALVACRLIDLVLAAPIGLWVACLHPRRLAWFLPGPVLALAALSAYNLYWFDGLTGAQSIHDSSDFHQLRHGVESAWSGDVWAGAAGTLFSPARGLFVYCPWVALALLALPATVRRLGGRSVVVWGLVGLIPMLAILSKYAVWWAGCSFGPRYWTEAMPLFAVPLAVAVERARGDRRWSLVPLSLAIAWAVSIQAIGAFRYEPDGWNQTPTSVDVHHDRLWDWRDTELAYCLRRRR